MSPSTIAPERLAADFKAAARRLAATVTIVTSRDTATGLRCGMTATAVTSLSAEPPSLLVCVNQSASMHRTLEVGGRFCVNVLGEQHKELAFSFGGRTQPELRFEDDAWSEDACGVPFLPDSVAAITCKADDLIAYATHTIVIACVEGVRVSEAGAPLIWADGGFTHLAKAGRLTLSVRPSPPIPLQPSSAQTATEARSAPRIIRDYRDLGPWPVMGVLFLATLLNICDRSIPGIVNESVRVRFHLGDFQLGLTSTAFTLVYAVAGVPIGRLSDTQRRVLDCARRVARRRRHEFDLARGPHEGRWPALRPHMVAARHYEEPPRREEAGAARRQRNPLRPQDQSFVLHHHVPAASASRGGRPRDA